MRKWFHQMNTILRSRRRHSCLIYVDASIIDSDTQKLSAPEGVPRRSPTLVLTGPCTDLTSEFGWDPVFRRSMADS